MTPEERAKQIVESLIVPDYRHDPNRWAQESPLSTEDLAQLIAKHVRQAETAAEQRGAEREREECARIVDKRRGSGSTDLRSIAYAIRKRKAPTEAGASQGGETYQPGS